jgi:hypothetical protein
MTLKHSLLIFLISKFTWADSDLGYSKLDIPTDYSEENSLELFVKNLLENTGTGIQDVGIFDLMESQDNLADRLHRCISATNPVLRFSGGSGSQNIVGGYKRKRLGFTVILSDANDPVSCSILC